MNHTRTNTLFTFCLCKLLQNKKIHWVRIKYAQNTACNSQALCYLLLRMPNINSLFEKWVLEVNHPSPHPFMEKYRLLWNSSTNKVHVMLYVMLCYILYHTIKVLKALQQTKNWQCLKKMQCIGYKMAAFSIFHFEGLIKHDPKYVKMETSATHCTLEESNHQIMIKKLTQ